MRNADLRGSHGANADECSGPPEFWLPEIDGRECVPVRLLPFMTEWWPLSPDKIAELLGSGEAIRRGKRWPISSYVLRRNGSYAPVLPRTWASVGDRLAALQVELGETQLGLDRSLLEWERRSIELMPAAVFVWRDELVAEYLRTYGRHKFIRSRPGAEPLSDADVEADLCEATHGDESATPTGREKRASLATMQLEGDGELSLEPVLSYAQSQVVFEGFGQYKPATLKIEVLQGAAKASLDGDQPAHWLELPPGTKHIVFRTLPSSLAKTLWPDHAGDGQAQFDLGFAQAGSSLTFRQELTEAARTGRLRVLNPLTLGTHTFPVGSDIEDALVTVGDLRQYLAERGIGVGFAAATNDPVSSAKRSGSSDERNLAGAEAQQAEAQSQDDIERGMLSVLVIAGMLSDVRELAGDARKPMVEKVIAGARVGAFPVFHRRLRASIAPPMEIDLEHMARVGDVLRWFNDGNEWPVRALLLKGRDGAVVHEYLASTVAQAVPSAAATADRGAGSTAGVGSVDKQSPARRKTWKDVAWPHMVEKLRAGRFATAVDLNHALHEEAGAAGSPFDKGTDHYRGSLWVREISAPLALKTIQNNWAELQKAASG